jgi:hypothetical protein
VQTPTAFLTAIGRKAQEKVPETDWDKFWAMGAVEFRTAELPVRDRRCVCALCRRRYNGLISAQVYHVGYEQIPNGPRPGNVRARGTTKEEDSRV